MLARTLRGLCRLLLAGLMAGFSVLTAAPLGPATPHPPQVALAAVAGGSADDVLGQLVNMDFSQPDFTHGGANDSTTAEALQNPHSAALDATNNRLFVADFGNSRALAYNLADGLSPAGAWGGSNPAAAIGRHNHGP